MVSAEAHQFSTRPYLQTTFNIRFHGDAADVLAEKFVNLFNDLSLGQNRATFGSDGNEFLLVSH